MKNGIMHKNLHIGYLYYFPSNVIRQTSKRAISPRIIADLHIHSHFSRVTYKKLDIPNLAIWARRKCVHIVGAGDITHPGWRAEMQESLARAAAIPATAGVSPSHGRRC